MFRAFTRACAIAALALLGSNSQAQLDQTITATSTQRATWVDTGWVSVAPEQPYVVEGGFPVPTQVSIGALACARPARLVGATMVRYTCLTENQYGQPVDEYQVYSRNEFHIAGSGLQLCSQLCGAVAGMDALAPSDGFVWPIPSPLPPHNVGVADPLSDHHLMPVEIAFPVDWGLPAGVHPIQVSVVGGMLTWNDEPVTHDSHLWRLEWPRYQVRVAGWLVR